MSLFCRPSVYQASSAHRYGEISYKTKVYTVLKIVIQLIKKVAIKPCLLYKSPRFFAPLFGVVKYDQGTRLNTGPCPEDVAPETQ